MIPADSPHMLSSPLDLPCGVRLKNRLAKSAMSDSLGDGAGNPTMEQIRLYERWANGGVALSVIGEVQISSDYPEKPGNLVMSPGVNLSALRELARRGSANGAHIWPQLGHAGALAHAPISTPKGPSAIETTGLKCDGLSLAEIRDLPRLYAQAAALAQNVGFGGVLIHAGHGFLLSQFLSPLFNRRSDAYGGSVERRFRVIEEVIIAIRDAVGSAFPIGIRINATDKLVGGLTTDDALKVVGLLHKTSIDLIDVSGGTYFPGAVAASDRPDADGVYFRDFAKAAKALTTIPISLTGGIRKRAQAVRTLGEGTADMVGLARAMVLDPSLAATWLRTDSCDPEFPVFDNPPSGGMTAWYSMRLTALGEDREASFGLDPAAALRLFDARDAERCMIWRNRFRSEVSDGQ